MSRAVLCKKMRNKKAKGNAKGVHGVASKRSWDMGVSVSSNNSSFRSLTRDRKPKRKPTAWFCPWRSPIRVFACLTLSCKCGPRLLVGETLGHPVGGPFGDKHRFKGVIRGSLHVLRTPKKGHGMLSIVSCSTATKRGSFPT